MYQVLTTNHSGLLLRQVAQMSVVLNRDIPVTDLNGLDSLLGNCNQRDGYLVFDGPGGDGLHGQQFGRPVCHIHFADRDVPRRE